MASVTITITAFERSPDPVMRVFVTIGAVIRFSVRK